MLSKQSDSIYVKQLSTLMLCAYSAWILSSFGKNGTIVCLGIINIILQQKINFFLGAKYDRRLILLVLKQSQEFSKNALCTKK